MESQFKQVKTALSLNPQSTLEALGVNFKHGLKGEWSQCLCMLCGDKSGSASITHEGFLRCHQCGAKRDIFEWYAETHDITEYSAMEQLADMLHVDLAIKRHRGRAPKEMTPERLRAATEALWNNKDAEPCRKFLKARGLSSPQLLEQFGVGFIAGSIVFAQWDQTGRLKTRYRKYTPGALPQHKWMWSPGKGGATGFWPYAPLRDTIWLMEGEFDVMTAWMRMRLQDQGITAFTWTGGAGAPIPAHMIPEQWRGKEIHILYDNDTFQGQVWEEYRAPNEKKKLEMEMRHKVLIEGIAASFQAQNCKVYLRTIPIDPLENWGGDFRDWVDGGGRDLADLKSYSFKNMAPKREAPIETDLRGVFGLIGKDVKTIGEVSTIQQEGISIYQHCKLECDMNQQACCANCKGPALFSSRLVDLKDYQSDLANALVSNDPNAYLLKHVIRKPPACVGAKILPIKYAPGTKWTAVHDNPEQRAAHELTVISSDEPSLSGNIEIQGRVHPHLRGGTAILLANQIRELDSAEIDLGPYINDLMGMCPTTATTPEAIQDYVDSRCADLAYHVTHIYGRQPIHIAHDLLMHSAINFMAEGEKHRGWLDISVIGETRTGKSKTFENLIKFHRLGLMHSCVQNVSKPGLTIGGVPSANGFKMKPGLFPRSHQKALILDEFHYMVKQDILGDLQTARDQGTVQASKIYGTRIMPAKVRFCTIANWPVDRYKFRFQCEHFMALYGTPEALSRTDFGLTVAEDPTESGPIEVPHLWTEELLRALILRGWAQDETMVHIQDKALVHAKQSIIKWESTYEPTIPLFTPQEKLVSLLRLAVAVANWVFSHPPGQPYHAEVRLCHVEWAVSWLEATWKWNEYFAYSKVRMATIELARPYDAEAALTVDLGLSEPEDATNILGQLLGGITQTQAAALTGKEHCDSMSWLNKLARLGVTVTSRNTKNTNWTDIQLTKAGNTAVRNLIKIAEEHQDHWKFRYKTLSDMGLIPSRTPDFTPITSEELFHVLRH